MASLTFLIDAHGTRMVVSGLAIRNSVVSGEQIVDGPDFRLTFHDSAPLPAEGADGTTPIGVALGFAGQPVIAGIDATIVLHGLEPGQFEIMGFDAAELKLDGTKLPNLEFKPSKVRFVQFGNVPWCIGLEPQAPAVVGEPRPPVARFTLLGVTAALGALEFDASGVRSASVSVDLRQPVPLGGFATARVVAAEVDLSGQQVTAVLTLAFQFEYFKGARGELEVHASRGPGDAMPWQVAAATRINSGVTWTDPTGCLSFDHMGLEIDVGAVDGNLKVTDIRTSGTVTFRADGLEAAAREWLGHLFSGMSTEFRNVSLWSGAAVGNVFRFSFKPRSGLRVKALDIFDLTIPAFSFGMDSIELIGSTLSLGMGDTSLKGQLARLIIELKGLPSIDPGNISIDMAMSAPGGIKASARLSYTHTETVDTIDGEGQLTTPTFPGVQVMFRVGRVRLKGSWLPTLVIYAAEYVDIPLFPGVVVHRLGIGLGVNMEVAGTTHLSLAEARARLADGLPDVSQPGSWTAPDRPTDLTLLARVFVSPSPKVEAAIPELYVADLTMIVTSDFQFAVMGKLWLLTSLEHAQTVPFQQHPTASALMLLDGQEPSLRAVAQTRDDGRTSAGAGSVVGMLVGLVPETHLAFEATSTGLAVVIGPNPIQGDLGPLQITGSSLLAIRSAPSRSYAISRSSLQARFAVSSAMSFGPVSISASLRFGFSSELALLGFYDNTTLTLYGHAHVAAYVEVNLHLSIGFSIRISLPFGRSIRISWHQDWDFNWQVAVDLDIALAVTSGGDVGLHGNAFIEVNVVGVRASLAVPVNMNPDAIDAGRRLQAVIEADLRTLTGLNA